MESCVDLIYKEKTILCSRDRDGKRQHAPQAISETSDGNAFFIISESNKKPTPGWEPPHAWIEHRANLYLRYSFDVFLYNSECLYYAIFVRR